MIKNLKLWLKFLTLSVAAPVIISACSSSDKTSQQSTEKKSQVVGTVDNTPVTYQELLEQYKMSDPGKKIKKDTATFTDLSSFLDLYLDYRAKLLEARNSGYFQDKDVNTEMNQYATEYAYTFWMDKKIRQELLDTLVARSKWDVDASHILIALPPDATPEDTLEAYDKLLEARRKFLNGESFSRLINEYSTKRNGRPMGGNLGYLSAGWTIKPFEDAAYTTPVDSVSMPVRTRFGYHLIYVHGRRKHIPDRLVSHIFFRTRGKGFSLQEAMKRADSVYAQLQNGVSWNKLIRMSDDINSRYQNGKIGWVSQNRYLPTFTDTIFAIRQLHKPYHPFYSGYGVHIVKIDSIRSFKDRKQKEEYWLSRLKQLPRYKDNKPLTLQKIKTIGDAQVYSDNYSRFVKLADKQDSLNLSKLDLPADLSGKPIYKINNHTYSVDDFVEWLKHRPATLATHLYSEYRQFQDSATEKQIVPITEQSFPQYKNDVQHYLNGLVVYKITNDSVWNYAQNDTTRLRRLFSSDSSKYWFPKRYEYYLIEANNDSSLNTAIDKIKKGVSPDSLQNHGTGHLLLVRKDIIDDLSGEPYNHLKGLTEGQVTQPFQFQNRQVVLYLSKILQPAQMSFDEAYNQLVSDFQPIRQKEWLENLHRKYKIREFQDRMHQIFWSNQVNN